MNAKTKCANPGCSCIVPVGKEYCSDNCAIAKDRPQLACQCSHAGCNGKH